MPENKKKEMMALKARCNALMQKVYAPQGKTIVFGDGSLEARLVLVGEAPGEQETLQGKPFVGKAGQNLDEFLQTLCISRESIYISNVVKFRPIKVHPRTGTFSNRPPDREEIELCRSFLLAELGIIRPKVVVTLGNVALKTLLDDRRVIIGSMHGNPTPAALSGVETMLFPLYHPASIIYNRALAETYQEDLMKLRDYLDEAGIIL